MVLKKKDRKTLTVVLEHLENSEALLKQAAKTITPGGKASGKLAEARDEMTDGTEFLSGFLIRH